MRGEIEVAHNGIMTLLGIDHVGFTVRDMDVTVRFYERVLGLHEVGATADRGFVALSWGDNVHDIALMSGPPPPCRSVHHVAITLQGGPDELRLFAQEIRQRGVNLE